MMNIAANLNAENSSHGASAKLAVAALHHRDIPQSLFREVMQHFTRLLGKDYKVYTSYWAFHKLEEHECLAMASHAVQESSLIIIASAEGLPVPENVQGFLDSGLMEQRNRSTLIVAIEESAHLPSDEPGALCTHAGHLASRWQKNFMCCQDRGSHESRQFIAAAIKSRLLEVTACGIHSNRQDGGRSVENASEWDGSSTLNPNVVSLRGEIQKLAYDLWLQDHRPHGKEQEFWFRAEKQIISHIALQEHVS